MASEIMEYKCPSCTAPLKFNAQTQKLECEYCGCVLDIEEAKRYQEAQQKKANRPEETPPDGNQEQPNDDSGNSQKEDQEKELNLVDSGEWDDSGIQDDWGADAQKMRAYNCPSCGAELICDSSTAATSCPYCGNQAVIPGQFTGALKPDYIIPFKITHDQAKEALRSYYKGKILLPSAFKNENHIQELKGIYVPFWLFDGEADGAASYKCTVEIVHDRANETEYITHHYMAHREGSIQFEKVPTDASEKMPDDMMDSIEPFDYQELQPFETAYLSGYLADRYDVTLEQSADRADFRCKNTMLDALRDTVVGYNTVVPVSKAAAVRRGAVHYALLPVYMLNTKWKDKQYYFAINGQTGKVVGNLPADKGKAVISGVLGFIGGTILAMLIGWLVF